MSTSDVTIVLELARTETPEDPYAFRFGLQNYTLRTPQGGRKRVQLDWTEALLSDIEALQTPQCDAAVIQRVAHHLNQFLQPAGWSHWAQEILNAHNLHDSVSVTIRASAAELYILPWELLPLEGTGQCVGELPHVLIRYEWPETQSPPPPPDVDLDQGQILVAWSSAGGPVPAAEHISAVEEFFKPGDPGYCSHHAVLPNLSLNLLAEALETAQKEGTPIRVLHLLCHGGRVGETMGLLLNDDTNRGDPVGVDAWRLRQVLAPYASTLRLVVVLACGSAQGGRFDSVAQALHRAGIETVIASRFLMSMTGSVQFTRHLYKELLINRLTVNHAFLYSKNQLVRGGSRLDWASVQLHTRIEEEPENPFMAASSSSVRALTPIEDVGLRASANQDDELSELMQLICEKQNLEDRASRYESNLALVYTELVDYVGLFNQLGPSAAQGLQARYRELFKEAVEPQHGRVFGDEAQHYLQACFPNVDSSLKAIFAFFEGICEYNFQSARENQLIVRVGVHHGTVLTDGSLVHGREVDFTKNLTEHTQPGEIHLSYPAFLQAPRVVRTMCRALPPLDIGRGRTASRYEISGRGAAPLPIWVINENTGEEILLPKQDIIAFGRLDKLADGTVANDIVLDHPEDSVKRAISRWHFELRRTLTGYQLRQRSHQSTHVNGQQVPPRQDVPIWPGTLVQVANRLKLRFVAPQLDTIMGAKTTASQPSEMTEANRMDPHEGRTDDLVRS